MILLENERYVQYLGLLCVHGRHDASDVLPDGPALFDILGLCARGPETEYAKGLALVGDELGQIGLRLIGYILRFEGFHDRKKLKRAVAP